MFIILCTNSVVFWCSDSETFYPSSTIVNHIDLATHIVTVLLSIPFRPSGFLDYFGSSRTKTSWPGRVWVSLFWCNVQAYVVCQWWTRPTVVAIPCLLTPAVLSFINYRVSNCGPWIGFALLVVCVTTPVDTQCFLYFCVRVCGGQGSVCLLCHEQLPYHFESRSVTFNE